MKKLVVALVVSACAAMAAQAGMLKVGEDVINRYDTAHPYPAAPEGAADIVFAKVLSFTDASYIAVHFSRFNLAASDYAVVRSQDGRQSFKYSGLGRGDLGESEGGFWASHIKGDTAIVELHGKAGGAYGFTIDRFARGYTQEESSPESICGASDALAAKCYAVSEPTIYDRGRAVARLLIQGSGLCTGWLIGNAGDLMTNAHCITSAADALNTDYEFNAEGATCATSCPQLACPGTIESTTATLTQISVPQDFALVRLPTNITPTYGYLRLRNASALVDERLYLLGHPGGKGKTFSVASTDATDQSGFCEVTNLTADPSVNCIPSATQLDVGYMCDTEGGSSGSPVLAYSDNKVVALHHCGGCPNSGVQITNVITALGANVPPGAVFDPVGVVTLDKTKYGCSSTIAIEVRDDSIIGAGTQAVTLASTTEVLPETVTLTESPAGSGKFVGTFPATSVGAANGDGMLSVANGDTITVTYIDANDGAGGVNVARTDTALADCVAPIITNVQATNVTGNSADITWLTNEAADSTVTYGVTPPPPGSTTSTATLVTSHSVHLTGLLSCRDHVFSVSSRDEAGNLASDNNGGAYYAFSTGANTNPIYQATGVPVAVPDNTPAGASTSIVVTDINTVTDVNVRVRITHTYDGDLDLKLTGPNAITIVLSENRGTSGDNFTNTVFDDSAATAIASGVAPFTGSFRPEAALSAFNGIPATGTWTLTVVDQANVDVGTIDSFELLLSYPPQGCGAFVQRQSHSVTDACSGTGSGGNTIVDPGEDLTIPVVLANTGTDPAAAVTAVLSTTTPGVSVTTASASYGTLNPGTSASGSNPYLVHVGNSVTCGSSIAFTITASAVGGGTWVSNFSVPVGTPTSSTTTYNSTDVPKPLPDVATANSVISVVDTSIVQDVNVRITLTHTFDGDLDIFLVGPNGAVVELSTDNGASGDNYTNTVFDDSAATSITGGSAPFTGTFRPEQSLSALNGIPANGTWTLRITDDASADVGTLTAWSIELRVGSGFTCNTCVVPTPPGPVGTITWDDKSTLSWSPVALATNYNVYRGTCSDLAKLHTIDVDSCQRATTPSTSASGLVEDVGCMFWLVRAQNGAGEGPAGSGTAGTYIHDSSGVCP